MSDKMYFCSGIIVVKLLFIAPMPDVPIRAHLIDLDFISSPLTEYFILCFYFTVMHYVKMVAFNKAFSM